MTVQERTFRVTFPDGRKIPVQAASIREALLKANKIFGTKETTLWKRP